MRLILLFIFFISSAGVYAQNAIISGRVTDQENQPVPFAKVSLEKTSASAMSGIDGNFVLSGISAGTYVLKTTAIGFDSDVRNISIGSSEEKTVIIQLQEAARALNEVVITTNRRTETLDEVPSSVSVLTEGQIQSIAQTSVTIADVINEIPGMAISTNQTSNTGQTLRGRKTLVLIDGIPQSTPLRNGSRDINTIDPNVIERIEVIKGATAIYGNGADGGIINYITKNPKTHKKLESTTQISTDGSLVNTEHTVGSKVSQTFAGRIGEFGYVASGNFRQTGIFRDANGEIISPTYGLGETDQYNLFTKMNYQIGFDHSVEFMYNYFSSNQDTEYINQPGIYGERPAIGVIGEVPGVDQGNRYNHNGQLTYDASNIIGRHTDLRLNLYFQDFKTVYGFSPSFFDPIGGYEGGQSTIESSKRGVRLNFKTAYGIGSEFSGDILYGVDLLNDITSQNLVDGRAWVPEMDMTNFAPYAQLKTRYSNFILKAGIRFENIHIGVPDYTTIYRIRNDIPSGGVDVMGGDLRYDATTYNVGLRYNRWNVFKPFVSFSQSFSIADLGRTLRTATENTVGQISSEAVIANNYEAGFNSRIGRTSLSGAYFISTSEFGATYREVDGIFQIARQPERVYGFELALDTKLTSYLSFGSSVSYTEGKLDSPDNGNYDIFMNGARIPPVKTVTYLQYNIFENFDARLSHIYSGNREHFDPNSTGRYTYGQGPVESFNLVNLSANYFLTPNTRLGLGVENLLNEDYYTPISQWDARPQNYSKGNGARFNLSLTVNL